MTDIEKVRTLTGTDSTDYSDAEVQFFLDMNDGDLYYAAGLLCDALAAKLSPEIRQVSIGDFHDRTGPNRIVVLHAQAATFRKLANEETPAFAVAEQNVSDFNELIMIRNAVLKQAGGI